MDDAKTTRAVVEAYFYAWTTHDIEAAYDCLAPDLEFIGPNARFTSAADFRPGLVGFAAVTRSAKISQLVVEGDRASVLYDCELTPPGGRTRIASFFRVEHGKIRWYETVFDPAGFHRLLEASRR